MLIYMTLVKTKKDENLGLHYVVVNGMLPRENKIAFDYVAPIGSERIKIGNLINILSTVHIPAGEHVLAYLDSDQISQKFRDYFGAGMIRQTMSASEKRKNDDLWKRLIALCRQKDISLQIASNGLLSDTIRDEATEHFANCQ